MLQKKFLGIFFWAPIAVNHYQIEPGYIPEYSNKTSETLHFGDDTCLLNIKDSVKQINKVFNKDFRFQVQWLNANRISLNVAKTEVVIFRRKRKQLDCDLNLKLCGKKLNQIM